MLSARITHILPRVRISIYLYQDSYWVPSQTPAPIRALHSNLLTHMTRIPCGRSVWGSHTQSITSLHRYLYGVSMSLIQIIKTSEDVSYAASCLSGAEILGVFQGLALGEAKLPELRQKTAFEVPTGGLRLIMVRLAKNRPGNSLPQVVFSTPTIA